MATKTFTFTANTINGNILEFPQTFYFPCGSAVNPIGVQVVRDYNMLTDCIRAIRVYTIGYANDIFGTTQFKTTQEFLNYRSQSCSCCPQPNHCYLKINNCLVTINGCTIKINDNLLLLNQN